MKKVVVLSLVFLVFMALSLCAEEKGTPILDQASFGKASIPTLYLQSCRSQNYSAKDVRSELSQWEKRKGIKLRNKEGGKYISEFWTCIKPNSKIAELWSDHNISDLKKLLPSSQKEIREIEERGVHITVNRYYLESPEVALAWAEIYSRTGFGKFSVSMAEGSYSGQPIGDKCWAQKPDASMSEAEKRQRAEWSKGCKHLVFVYKDTMVDLSISSASVREVPVSYIEDVARIIISKL